MQNINAVLKFQNGLLRRFGHFRISTIKFFSPVDMLSCGTVGFGRQHAKVGVFIREFLVRAFTALGNQATRQPGSKLLKYKELPKGEMILRAEWIVRSIVGVARMRCASTSARDRLL